MIEDSGGDHHHHFKHDKVKFDICCPFYFPSTTAIIGIKCNKSHQKILC